MDEKAAERLLYVEATLDEMIELAGRGREAFEMDVAIERACEYNVIRLAADLERLGEAWLHAHPAVPWRMIKGMRNRIAHNYWTVNDDIVWTVVNDHAPALKRALAAEFQSAKSTHEMAKEQTSPESD